MKGQGSVDRPQQQQPDQQLVPLLYVHDIHATHTHTHTIHTGTSRLNIVIPSYLHNLISVQRHRSSRSSSVVTLARLPSSSSHKITDLSFRYASPCHWNQLPLSLGQPHSGTSSSISYSPIPSPITYSSFDSPLCSSITPSVFHFRL